MAGALQLCTSGYSTAARLRGRAGQRLALSARRCTVFLSILRAAQVGEAGEAQIQAEAQAEEAAALAEALEAVQEAAALAEVAVAAQEAAQILAAAPVAAQVGGGGSGGDTGGGGWSPAPSGGGSGDTIVTLPSARSFTGSSVTEGQFKTSLSTLLDYLGSSLGASSGTAAVLSHLGSPLSSHRTISGSTTLTGADKGRIIESTTSSSVTVSLPSVRDIDDGYSAVIIARFGTVTLESQNGIYGHRTAVLKKGRAALVFVKKSAGTWGIVTFEAGNPSDAGSSVYVDSGQIAHGDQLPKPAGYTWDQCEWVVTIEDPTCGYRDVAESGSGLTKKSPGADHCKTRESVGGQRSPRSDRYTTISR